MRIVAFMLVAFALGCAQKEPAPTTSASASAPVEKPPFREMAVEDVAKRVLAKDGKTFVYDANPREVFDKRHVPGAVYVPDEGVTASLLPPDKGATLIFYCANTH